MSRSHILPATGVIVVCMAMGGLGFAMGAAASSRSAPVTRAVANVDAPGVRAAAFVAPDGHYLRKKGFGKVSKPWPGTYCLQLPKGMSPDRVIPMASIEYENSPTVDLLAEWDSTGDDCTEFNRAIEIDTLKAATEAQSDAAFTVVVP